MYVCALFVEALKPQTALKRPKASQGGELPPAPGGDERLCPGSCRKGLGLRSGLSDHNYAL